MKKSYVILFEVIIILSLLSQLLGKISIKEVEFNFGSVLFKTHSSEEVLKTEDFTYNSPYLWTKVYVYPSDPEATREDFFSQRAILLKREKNTSDPKRWGEQVPQIFSSKDVFLWKYATVDLTNVQQTRDSFFEERVILANDENIKAKTTIPEKDTELIPDRPTEFLWTNVKVYPYGIPTTRESFSAKRAELLSQEKNSK